MKGNLVMKGNQLIALFLFLKLFFFDCIIVAFGENGDSSDNVNISWGRTKRETFNYLSALRSIRKDEIDIAVEELEFNLDAIVTRLWKMRGDLPQDDRQTANKLLGFVQVYRTQYPRKINPDIEFLEIRLKTYEQAEKILSKFVGVDMSSGNKPDHKKSDEAVDDFQDKTDAVVIDDAFEELRYAYNKYVLVKNWNLAKITLERILDAIPNPNDDRHLQAKKRLQEIQETGSTVILDR